MNVEEWPIAAPGAASPSPDPAPRVPVDAAARLAAARADFFLDPAFRLSDQQRALMTAMLTGLVGAIADEIRVRLTEAQSDPVDADTLVERLANANLLQSDELIGLLLRRADEARIAAGARRVSGGGVLTMLSGDEDPAIASAAMALVIARGRSRDRFGRPGLGIADLDADLAVTLVHAIAASLATEPSSRRGLASAADDLLARHDDGHRPEAQEARLVQHLDSADRLESDLLLTLARQGEAGLLGEALARMAAIPGDDGRTLAHAPGGAGLPMLLRLANQSRAVAAALFAESGEVFGIVDPADAIDAFDAIDDADAEAERRRLRLPAPYRAAMMAFDAHG